MKSSDIKLLEKSGPLFVSERFQDTKDPCIVFDGNKWHIFGSGGSSTEERWHILHAIAEDISGPWMEIAPAYLNDMEGPHVAAPGVVYDPADKQFHMAIQQDFTSIGGSIHYLVSPDGN